MKRLFQSLSSTNDGAFIIDTDHRIIFWNQAAEKILEYTAEEVAGEQCYEILGGRDEQGITLCQRYCWIAIQAERGDVLPNTDVYAHTRDGEGRWLNVTTFVYPSAIRTHGSGDCAPVSRCHGKERTISASLTVSWAASEQLQKDDSIRISNGLFYGAPNKRSYGTRTGSIDTVGPGTGYG